MNGEQSRTLLDSFYKAQLVFATLPPLPNGMTPQYVHIIDAITHIEQEKGSVCISDVAAWFHVSAPGITRSITSLEKLGAVEKVRDEKDRRVVHIALTPLGKHWYDIYLDEYHGKLSSILSVIPDRDVETTIQTINRVVALMEENPISLTGVDAGGDTNGTDKNSVQKR